MAMNKYVGWGITTLLSYLLNNSDSDDTDSDPAELSAEQAELGSPVPVVMGRQIVKSPLVIYYGDFSSKAYTEDYGGWAEFDAWPLILSAIVVWANSAATGHTSTPHTHKVTTTGGAGNTTTTTPDPIPVKEKVGPSILMNFVMWLLTSLINGHLLRTTIQKGFKYYLGYQLLVCCSGDGIRLRKLYIGPSTNDKEVVWSGDVSRDSYPSGYTISVDDDELFGGADEGGGFVGEVRVYLGGASQPADSWMIGQMNSDSIAEELRGKTPAYRPFVSVVVPTAYIGKQASIPEMWLDVQFIPSRLGLGGIGDNDANPAEVIYEMIVNDEWGLGRDPALINVDSLVAVGKTLATEGRGVSLKITSRDEVQTWIDNLCDHLDMVRYTEPTTGKLTFKLIRNDYEIDDLSILDTSIVKAIEYTRTVWSNSKGEIIAKYSDSAAYYGTSSVTSNDPAIIEMNDGDRNSEEVDFSYFTTSTNAAWGANRELKQRGYPLAAVRLTCNRKASGYRPGDVVKLNWNPYGISNLVLRISDVDLGDFVSGDVIIEAVEDVFGVGKTTYSASDTTSWTKPDIYPTGVQLFRYFEAPWEILQSKESYVYAAAVQPDASTPKWNIWRYKDQSWLQTNSLTKWTPAGQLTGSLAEDSSVEDTVGFEVIDLGGTYDLATRRTEAGLALARNGTRILMIGDEVMGWGTIAQLANGNFKISNVLRGIYDTVPQSHAAGDTVYFLDAGYYGNVTTGGPVCAAGYTVSEKYNITTETADEEEEFSDAKVMTLTTIRRPERPNPPGRIRLTSHLNSAVSRLSQAAGDVTVAWAVRNKSGSVGVVSQDDISDYYTGQGIQAATGLQTIVRAYLGTTLIHEEILSQTPVEDAVYPDTPTTWAYTWAQRCQDSLDFSLKTRMEICSKLNSLESYQSHSRNFAWQPPYIADACADETEAAELIANIYSVGSVTVSFDDASLNKTIAVADMPVIVLGTVYDAEQTGAVLAQNGKWVVPNGTLLAITGAGTYDTITMTDGYVLLSYLNPDSLGSLTAYQYDGTSLAKIAVPAL